MLKLRESNLSLPMISSHSVEARSSSLRSEMSSLRFSNLASVGVLRAETMVLRSCLAQVRCFSSEVSLRYWKNLAKFLCSSSFWMRSSVLNLPTTLPKVPEICSSLPASFSSTASMRR